MDPTTTIKSVKIGCQSEQAQTLARAEGNGRRAVPSSSNILQPRQQSCFGRGSPSWRINAGLPARDA